MLEEKKRYVKKFAHNNFALVAIDSSWQTAVSMLHIGAKFDASIRNKRVATIQLNGICVNLVETLKSFRKCKQMHSEIEIDSFVRKWFRRHKRKIFFSSLSPIFSRLLTQIMAKFEPISNCMQSFSHKIRASFK